MKEISAFKFPQEAFHFHEEDCTNDENCAICTQLNGETNERNRNSVNIIITIMAQLLSYQMAPTREEEEEGFTLLPNQAALVSL